MGQFEILGDEPSSGHGRRMPHALKDEVGPAVANQVLGPTDSLRLGLEYRYLAILVAGGIPNESYRKCPAVSSEHERAPRSPHPSAHSDPSLFPMLQSEPSPFQGHVPSAATPRAPLELLLRCSWIRESSTDSLGLHGCGIPQTYHPPEPRLPGL
jgi:hypothetical protein